GIGSHNGTAADTKGLRQPAFRRQASFWRKFAGAHRLLKCAGEAFIQRPLSLSPRTEKLHNLVRIHNRPLSLDLDMESQSLIPYTHYSRAWGCSKRGNF